MNHKDTIERRETGSQAKEGDREEERLNESQGYTGSLEKEGDREEERLNESQGNNRKERDRLAGKGHGRRETE